MELLEELNKIQTEVKQYLIDIVGYSFTVKALAKELSYPEEILQIVLKRLLDKGEIETWITYSAKPDDWDIGS